MIQDEAGRYVATQRDETRLWRYDKRWRTVTVTEPTSGAAFFTLEGSHHAGLVTIGDDRSVRIQVYPAHPGEPIASGVFDGSWHFEGDNAAWAKIPEYLVVPAAGDEPAALLRIADGAELDPLEGFEGPRRVEHVPDSRLVVITTAGAFTVYDPTARRSIRHYELAGGNPDPIVHFRNVDELWIDDSDTLLKIDARQFEVLDAAGSDLSETGDDVPGGQGGFGRWRFVAGGELCLVTRPNVGDVLVLDVVSMLPVARGVFGEQRPVDATLLGRNTVVAMDSEGHALRARLRRVTIKFDATPDAES